MSTSETKSQTDSVPEKSPQGAAQERSIDPHSSELDLIAYHEHNAGRLVVDPEYVITLSSCSWQVIELFCREAKIEFGEAVASRLKLSADGTKVLWPQPADDPEDPQNVSLKLVNFASAV